MNVSPSPLVGVPPLALQVPALEPVNVTCSPGPTVKRLLPPVGAGPVVHVSVGGAADVAPPPAAPSFAGAAAPLPGADALPPPVGACWPPNSASPSELPDGWPAAAPRTDDGPSGLLTIACSPAASPICSVSVRF